MCYYKFRVFDILKIGFPILKMHMFLTDFYVDDSSIWCEMH